MCTHGFDSTMNDCIEAPVAPKSESVLETAANWVPAASTFVPESGPFLIVITIILVTVIFAISGLLALSMVTGKKIGRIDFEFFAGLLLRGDKAVGTEFKVKRPALGLTNRGSTSREPGACIRALGFID
jgi:hypothetical protein